MYKILYYEFARGVFYQLFDLLTHPRLYLYIYIFIKKKEKKRGEQGQNHELNLGSMAQKIKRPKLEVMV